MKRFKYIIQSETAPSIENIGLQNGELFYYDGGWKSLKDRVSISNPSVGEATEASKVAPIIKLNNTGADLINNIKTCSELSTTEVVSVDVEGTIGGVTYDAVGIYHNGTVSILEGNKVTVFDIDFNTGRVIIDSKYDTSKLLPYVDLQIGNSESVKAYNKERRPTGSFFIAIDYGFGTGTWNSTTGGQAHIVTAYGNMVYYSISKDGVVAKMTESPDLYYEYTQMGGSNSPTQFARAIADLVGV